MSEPNNLIFFIYGSCTMFYAVMVWLFWRKGNEPLSRLVTAMMGLIGLQCVKDTVFYHIGIEPGGIRWIVMSAWDMVVVPLYAAVLVELCRPGRFSWRKFCIDESLFVLPALLVTLTRDGRWFDIEVGWCALYGCYYACWTFRAIPRYNKALKEQFSYTERINLDWLRGILYSFFFILSLWVLDCIYVTLWLDGAYLISSMAVWMFICYFIYRHESVVREVSRNVESRDAHEDDGACVPADARDLGEKIRELFVVQRVFLNPRLKLSDVAQMIGSNRTYVSNWFNSEARSAFYDYVNNHRVEHACRLLRQSRESLALVAEESGFNSLSTFHRVFSKIKGMTPAEFRNREATE